MKSLMKLADELKQAIKEHRTARKDAWVELEKKAKTDAGARMLLESLEPYHNRAATMKA